MCSVGCACRWDWNFGRSGDLTGRRLATNHSRQPTEATAKHKPTHDTIAKMIRNKTGPAKSTVGSMVVVLRIAFRRDNRTGGELITEVMRARSSELLWPAKRPSANWRYHLANLASRHQPPGRLPANCTTHSSSGLHHLADSRQSTAGLVTRTLSSRWTVSGRPSMSSSTVPT